MTLAKSCSELWRCQSLKAKFEKPSLKLANDWGMRSTCLEKCHFDELHWDPQSKRRVNGTSTSPWNEKDDYYLTYYRLHVGVSHLGVYIIEDTPAAAPLKKKEKNRRTTSELRNCLLHTVTHQVMFFHHVLKPPIVEREDSTSVGECIKLAASRKTPHLLCSFLIKDIYVCFFWVIFWEVSRCSGCTSHMFIWCLLPFFKVNHPLPSTNPKVYHGFLLCIWRLSEGYLGDHPI